MATKRPSVTTEPGTAANGSVRIGTATTTKNMREPRAGVAQGVSLADSTPIAMLHTSVLQGRPWRGNNTRRGEHGQERLPGYAHTDVTAKAIAEPTRRRYRTMLDAAGNEISVVHSNGSAHAPEIVDGKWSTDGYARFTIAKGYAIGRIEHPETGGCLKRQLADRRVNPSRLFTLEDIKKAPVCKSDAKACKHYEAERDARRNHHAKAESEIADRHRSDDSKNQEKLVAAAGAGASEAIAAALAKVLPTILAELKAK